MSETFVVRSQAQADLLQARESFLGPFAHQECSVSAAARLLDVPVPRLHYWVQRYARSGLLVRTRVEKRPGRAIQHYRLVATRFRIPADFLGARPSADRIRAALESMLGTSYAGEPMEAWITYRSEGLSPHVQIHPPLRQPARGVQGAPDHWLHDTLYLSDAEAREMLAELLGVVRRYAALHAEGEGFPAHGLLMFQSPEGRRG